MSDKLSQIRKKIIPQLECLSDNLFDYYGSEIPSLKNHISYLDKITEELITILNTEEK